jgi:hypothetical protein
MRQVQDPEFQPLSPGEWVLVVIMIVALVLSFIVDFGADIVALLG